MPAEPEHLSASPAGTMAYCVLVPTYNNEGTLENVLQRILSVTGDVIVVNDGSTDRTANILNHFTDIHIVTHEVNLGKGAALATGFEKARSLGYTHAVTIDSDGQHFPEDIHLLVKAAEQEPDGLFVGARELKNSGQPSKNSFANRFSNFWFSLETGVSLPDTQSGFRIYPLGPIRFLKINTIHYDYELEILVKSVWAGTPVSSVQVRVYYPPDEERVSHFKPFKDFARITLLNVRLVFLALLWYRPLLAIRNFSVSRFRQMVRQAFNDPEESAVHKSHSVAIGIFFGIVPIWGYQLISAIFAAYLLKLNKAIVILTAQISIPPMIPAILYLSIKTGELATGDKAMLVYQDISFDTVGQQLSIYLIGACVLAVIGAAVSWILTYFLVQYNRRRRATA